MSDNGIVFEKSESGRYEVRYQTPRPVMTLDEAETRLSQERSYLIAVEHGGIGSIIKLAQANVAHWEEVVRTKRLEESGGWKQ